MKLFIALVAAAALAGAPVAQASPSLSDEEVDFINDLEAVGIVNSGGPESVVRGGWIVCNALSQGYPRNWVAQQIHEVSQESNGMAGVSYSAAQALVFYANANLCPGVGA